MTFTEILVVVAGLLVGYWVISWLISVARGRGHDNVSAGHEPNDAGHAAGDGNQAESGDVDTRWIQAHWPDVLGVSPGAKVEEIKSAYRMRIRQYHPDRTEGLGSELRTLALRKTQALNVAHAWAMRLAASSSPGRGPARPR